MNQCLVCYEKLNNEKCYHSKCAQLLFGVKDAPSVDFSLVDIEELASQNINQRVTIPGVQPKMSLGLLRSAKGVRLTIVGLWGDYVFKPPFAEYPNLPENEDLTMNLASLFNIKVAIHGLVRLKTGELGYLVKRFDRIGDKKLQVEDLCQLSELPTASKYYSSMEKVGRVIRNCSSNPGYEMTRLFELTLFSFLTGNADMHLKNFSLLTNREGETGLSPAYDLVSTKLAIPADKEETALSINGKKSNLTKKDFLAFATNLGVREKAVKNTMSRFETKLDQVPLLIEKSFLPAVHKEAYFSIFLQHQKRLF